MPEAEDARGDRCVFALLPLYGHTLQDARVGRGGGEPLCRLCLGEHAAGGIELGPPQAKARRRRKPAAWLRSIILKI